MYNIEYSKQFLKDLKNIKQGDPNRIKQIGEIMHQIKLDPFSSHLHIKKLKGLENKYRYEIGKKYRILVEIIITDNYIQFLRIGRRENFY